MYLVGGAPFYTAISGVTCFDTMYSWNGEIEILCPAVASEWYAIRNAVGTLYDGYTTIGLRPVVTLNADTTFEFSKADEMWNLGPAN